jgi:hypothetical protein
MAYLRKEEETVEMDFPIDKVWKAISETLISLEWSVEKIDESSHIVEAKTKSGFLSYGSKVSIQVFPVNQKTTRVTIVGETTVTTITGIVSFGQTRMRIDSFFKQLSTKLS